MQGETLTQKELPNRLTLFNNKISDIEKQNPDSLKDGDVLYNHYRTAISPIVGDSTIAWDKKSDVDYDIRSTVNSIFHSVFNIE